MKINEWYESCGNRKRSMTLSGVIMSGFCCHVGTLTATVIFSSSMAFANGTPDNDPTIDVQRRAGMVIIDVSMALQAPPEQVWQVLTDYDHMAEFFPNLRSSKVIGRVNGRTTIEQKGVVSYGPLSVPFSSLREIELKPYTEIRSRAVGGSVKRGMAVTTLTPVGNSTEIIYHSESEPNVWVPPGIGPKFIRDETRAQFESLRREILKRSKGE
jgi:carbon monoxide dehydrogenase subunit G